MGRYNTKVEFTIRHSPCADMRLFFDELEQSLAARNGVDFPVPSIAEYQYPFFPNLWCYLQMEFDFRGPG